ncbi:glycosyltransferase [Algoriphagus sp.]|uniref:glycosyltransferase n=1 Tax=Algoriphagus sp. TaxID=1872435 RepID=UPI00271AD3AD|nr:glycosyltransferase [Algoriphagus sp.]MDO8965935.1 glycosyltransferase family 2 protein [Algoriphagus sp.]MDP3198461.1 glycosyltransferase family 2 protein [Algoriphagus sp.]
MMIWLVGIVGLLIIQYLLLLFFLKTGWKDHFIKTDELPKVSVLIAARNEEKDLPNLLRSLEGLNYPIEKLEILIADDQSLDQTALLIAAWAKKGANRNLISIQAEPKDEIQRNGKANALAVLCEKASGDFFFFTDADCEVPQNWILEGINCFGQEVGLVLGITQVKSKGWFEKMQEIDWWNTLGIVKIVTDLKLPTTGLGNNMVISRPAYLASGGFEKIPFSLTEDLEISKAIRKVGYSIRHQVSENFLVKTKAEKGLNALLQQRKRWMAGAMTLSWAWKTLLGLQFLFFPAVLVLVALHWSLGLILFGSKIIIQSLFLAFFSKKGGQKIGTIPLLLFDFYQIWNLSLTILYYFWPGQVEWKSRKYA